MDTNEVKVLRENLKIIMQTWQQQTGKLREALLSKGVDEDGLSRVTMREVQGLTGISDEGRVRALLTSLLPLPEDSEFTQETILKFDPEEISEEEL